MFFSFNFGIRYTYNIASACPLSAVELSRKANFSMLNLQMANEETTLWQRTQGWLI